MTEVTYWRHNCERQHRSWRTLAKCIWRRAVWIIGDGQYASVSYCPGGASVHLWPTRDEAKKALEQIDRVACGGRCQKNHKLVTLSSELMPSLANDGRVLHLTTRIRSFASLGGRA